MTPCLGNPGAVVTLYVFFQAQAKIYWLYAQQQQQRPPLELVHSTLIFEENKKSSVHI